ncbi:MAG: DUF2798 domain-containing protein [Phycisphaerae bacterium]|nr:DUF2798 domain-containing protein [Phycisphaerae bacterium]
MNLKLTKPQGQFFFIFLMCLFMSACMSLAMTFVRLGFTRELIDQWLKNWVIAFVIAVPAALFFVPLSRRIADAVTRKGQ